MCYFSLTLTGGSAPWGHLTIPTDNSPVLNFTDSHLVILESVSKSGATFSHMTAFVDTMAAWWQIHKHTSGWEHWVPYSTLRLRKAEPCEFRVEGLGKWSHSFPSKSDIFNPPMPLLFTWAILNTFASFHCHLCGVDSAVHYQTSANSRLSSCDTGEQTCNGRNGKTMSACMTTGKNCSF